MQKINELKTYQYGLRGLAVAIPRIFAKDNGIEKGHTVEIYRDQIQGKDALILIPKSIENQDLVERAENNRVTDTPSVYSN